MSDEFCPVRNTRYMGHKHEDCLHCVKADREMWRKQAEEYKAIVASVAMLTAPVAAPTLQDEFRKAFLRPKVDEPAPPKDERITHYWGQGGVKCDAPLDDSNTVTTSNREAVTCPKCVAAMAAPSA